MRFGLLDIRFEYWGRYAGSDNAVDHRTKQPFKLAAWRSVCGAGGKYRLGRGLSVYTGTQKVVEWR